MTERFVMRGTLLCVALANEVLLPSIELREGPKERPD